MSTTSPVHQNAASLPETTLQTIESNRNQSTHFLQVPDARHSQSRLSNQSFNQSEVSARASTRGSYMSTGSNWTSVSKYSNISGRASTLKPSLFPSSGFPGGEPPDPAGYPTSGYPVFQNLHHSYGYPDSPFPLSPIPGTDLTMTARTLYPSSDFPTGGTYPGEFEQDDGSQPFIGTDVIGADVIGTGYGPGGGGAYPYDPWSGGSVGDEISLVSYPGGVGMLPNSYYNVQSNPYHHH